VTLLLGSGAPLAAGPRLAAGGQGEVFAVESPPGYVFKKYFPRELSKDPELEARLLSMVSNPPAGWRELSGHVTMAWPADIVYEDGRFAGFIMPVIDMASTAGIHRLTNPSDRNRKDQGPTGAWMARFSWRYLVRTAVNLVKVTHAMHAAGTVIGDFNDANVRVGRDATVTLLDCDSMQISDPATGTKYLCRVGRPEFTAPELLHEDWSVTVREPSSDIFAMAIHLYALLLEGEHPFRGVWDWEGEKPEVTELAARGIWANLEGGPLIPRPAAIGLDLLPVEIRTLFRAAFEHGSYSPDDRPGAGEWHHALRELEGGLRTCAVNAGHVYPGFHGGACPWCEHARRLPSPPPARPADPPKPPPARPAAPSPPPPARPTATSPASSPASPRQRRPGTPPISTPFAPARRAMRLGKMQPRLDGEPAPPRPADPTDP
jgi:DNA-binding helix-hairpin-helix protein with protein kinase domain